MALTRSTPWALTLSGTSRPIEQESLRIFNEPTEDRLRSGGQIRDDLIQIVGKRPAIRAVLTDPTLVTAFQLFGAGKTYTSMAAVWQDYASNAGLAATYNSYTLANGILLPVSIQAGPREHAKIEVLGLGIMTAGVGFVIGTTSAASATNTAAYYPGSVTVGGASIGNMVSIQHNWNYQVQDDDQLEPAYYYYDRAAETGTMVLKDLDKVTVARLEDGATEAVVLNFDDANSAGTQAFSLGNCKVFIEIDGKNAQLTYERLAA